MKKKYINLSKKKPKTKPIKMKKKCMNLRKKQPKTKPKKKKKQEIIQKIDDIKEIDK